MTESIVDEPGPDLLRVYHTRVIASAKDVRSRSEASGELFLKSKHISPDASVVFSIPAIVYFSFYIT